MKKIITLIVALSVTPMAFGQEYNPENIIKYRQDFMQGVKSHNNDIKAIVNGAVPFNSHLGMHLSALEQMFDKIGGLFPEGSDFGDTKAKDAVWDNPQKFKDTVNKSKQALATFKQVAEKGDMKATQMAFKQFGRGSCGSCHKSFKKKD